MSLDALRAAVGDLQTAAQDEHNELDAVVQQLGQVEGALSSLQTQVAQGGGVSQADIDAVASQVSGVASAARSAVESAKSSAAVAGSGGTTPAPTGGTPAPTPAPTAPAPTGGTPAPAPTPASPTSPAPSAPAAEQSVYVFDGDPSTVDTTVWPSSGLETQEATPRPLFHYSSDVNPGETNGDGVGGVWHVYTGPTQPASTAAGGEA